VFSSPALASSRGVADAIQKFIGHASFKTKGVSLPGFEPMNALSVGKLEEAVSPTMYALPRESTATAGGDVATSEAGGGKPDDEGKKDNIDICHYDKDSGLYHLINVSGNAEPAHRKHGDAGIGEEVPAEAGKVFSDEYVPSVISIDIEKATRRKPLACGNARDCEPDRAASR